VALPSLSGRRTTIVLLALASVTLLTFDLRGSSVIDGARDTALDVTAPLRSLGHTVAQPFENAWNGVFNYSDLERENEVLREQVEAQEGASIAAEAQIRDYQELLEANDLPSLSEIPTVVARVVGGPPSNWELTVEINQGSKAGIRVGMAVVSPAGLVGRVTRTTENRSVVRLISDPELSVAVKLVGSEAAPPPDAAAAQPTAPGETTPTETTLAPDPNVPPPAALPPSDDPAATTVPTPSTVEVERERGILHGEGRGRDLSVDLVDTDANVNVGDAVVTSGIDTSLAPADIPVGRVSSVRRSPGSFQLDIQVEPAADLESLTFVTVLLYVPEL
jgi:cell shape-determining protein MreC